MDPTQPSDPNALALSILDAVMHKQWRMLAAFALILVVSLLKYALPKISDRFAFFKTDRGGALVVLVLSELGAVATALMAKAPLSPELFVTALSTGFMAAGGYVVVKRLLWPSDVKAAAAKVTTIAILIGATFLAGCACWQPTNPKFSTPECVLARKTVQCGMQGISEALAQTLAAIPTQQWPALLDSLKSDGGTAVGCLLADLPTVFSSQRMSANPMSAVYKASAESLFDAYRKKNKYEGVKFCFLDGNNQQVCR